MNLEERVAQAVVTKAQAVAPPIVDIDDIRRRGRRQARRRTAVSVAAVAVLVGGTIWGASTLSDLDQSSEPTNQTPSNPDSLRPLTYAEDGTIHYGDKTIEVGPELNGLTVTDYGVAFTTQDGRIWFSDGDAPEQVGVDEPGGARAVGLHPGRLRVPRSRLGGGRLDRRLRGVVRVPGTGRDRDRRL